MGQWSCAGAERFWVAWANGREVLGQVATEYQMDSRSVGSRVVVNATDGALTAWTPLPDIPVG
jgi:hypothetical protein